MRRLLFVSLLVFALPIAAEARRIPVHSLGHADPMDLSLGHGHSGPHGLALGLGHGSGPGFDVPPFNVPPGPPQGFPPGPPPNLDPPGLGLGHGGFPRTRLGNHPLAPVPEPGTVVLLAGGLLGLAWKSRPRH